MTTLVNILGWVVVAACANYAWILLGRYTWGPVVRRIAQKQMRRDRTSVVPRWSWRLDIALSGPLAWAAEGWYRVERRRKRSRRRVGS